MSLAQIRSFSADLTIYTDGSATAGLEDGGNAGIVTTGDPEELDIIDILKAPGRKFTSSYLEEKAAIEKATQGECADDEAKIGIVLETNDFGEDTENIHNEDIDADHIKEEESDNEAGNPFWFCGPPHTSEAVEDYIEEETKDSKESALKEVKHAVEMTAVDIRQIDLAVKDSAASTNEALDYIREAVKDAANDVKCIESVVQRLEKEADNQKVSQGKYKSQLIGNTTSSNDSVCEDNSDTDDMEKDISKIEKAVREAKRDVKKVEAAVQKFAQIDLEGKEKEDDEKCQAILGIGSTSLSLETTEDEESKKGKCSLDNQHLISENCVLASTQSKEAMELNDNGEGCSVEHVYYGGEIINCERCTSLQHPDEAIDEKEEVEQCPTDHIIYGGEIINCESCSKSNVSSENEERCSSSPPSHARSSPTLTGESSNIECPNEHIRYGGEIINCSSCCNLPLSYPELSKVVKGRRASSTPPSSSRTNANNSLVQRGTPPTPPPSPTYKSRSGGLSWTYQREMRFIERERSYIWVYPVYSTYNC